MIRFAAFVPFMVHFAAATPLAGQEQALPLPTEWSTQANADPAVRAGRLHANVREWWVPSEQLP